MKKTICWISGGVSSFVAGYMLRDIVDEFIYIHIDDHHEDTLRFNADCEAALGRKFTILQSPYKTVESVILSKRFIKSAKGAPCTGVLKRRVSDAWKRRQKDFELTYVWGFDYTEHHRVKDIKQKLPEINHIFPLIDKMLSKEDVHAILERLSISRPTMYDLGYNNNNCIGCVKGGMGYWNKIRVDFPEVFWRFAKLEREIGGTCLKDKNGRVFLDELDPARGRMTDEILQECGILCELVMMG